MLRPNPFADKRVCVRCTRCDALIHAGGGSFLALVGYILKLRCMTCDFEDWYLESEFFIPNYYSAEPKITMTQAKSGEPAFQDF